MCRSCCCCCKKAPAVRKTDWKTDVVYLYQFPRTAVAPNLSPFCLKIETWLRAHKISYEVVESYRTRSKYGKVPFIELNGQQIADSQLIIFELQKHFKIDEDAKLSPERLAISRTVDRMVEGSTFFSLIYSKMYRNMSKFTSANVLGGPFPNFLRMIITPLFRNRIKSNLDAHGYGKFDDRDILDIQRRDISAIATLLGNDEYFGGKQPCTADFTVFGHLATCQYVPIEQPMKDLIGREFPKLKEHLQRMRDAYWPDWDEPKIPKY